MELKTTYLDAIQAIPGDSQDEKFRYISKLAHDSIKNKIPIDQLLKTHKLPKKLSSLYEIEVGRIEKNNEKILLGLKSEDSMIINKALGISTFFKGNDKNIFTIDYIKNNLLPQISLNTRLKIIKKLGIHLNSKDLADQLFTMFSETYGLGQSLPLLIACNEDFIIKTITEHELFLPMKIMKMLYRRHPKLIVKYLQYEFNKSNVKHYIHYLEKLIKTHFIVFIQIFETCEKYIPKKQLSKNLATIFMKEGKHYLIEKPQLYIQILPLDTIDSQTMKIIFPKLFPDDRRHFSTQTMLDYLKYYPKKEKLSLLVNSFGERYYENIYTDRNNITPDLMLLLPTTQRIERAKELIKEEKDENSYDFKRSWRCYLSIDETIPLIKEEISKTSIMEDRAHLLVQMMYCCKVNQDDQALLELLQYFHIRHKNEQSWLFNTFVSNFLDQYDLQTLTSQHWELINNIIRRSYVQGTLQPGSTATKLLSESILHQLKNNLCIDQTISTLIELKAQRREDYTWNILTPHPNYEKLTLKLCIDIVTNKYSTSPHDDPWIDNLYGILHDLLYSIREYRTRHEKKIPLKSVISSMNYPKLIKTVKFDTAKDNDWQISQFKRLLKECDVYEIYEKLDEEDTFDLTNGKALSILRKNPEKIIQRSEDYLKECKRLPKNKQVQRFVKTIRWYREIPIKWFSQCQSELTRDKNCEALYILGILLDGDSFSTLIHPFQPKQDGIEIEDKTARENYHLISTVPRVMNIINPPPPLNMVSLFCRGDYLTPGLTALTNVCRRSSINKVLPFVKELSNGQISVKKHGIRLMCMVGSMEELVEYLTSRWKIETHRSIRAVLVNSIFNLFTNVRNPTTWRLMKICIQDYTLEDVETLEILTTKFDRIPRKNVAEYIELLLGLLDRLKKLDQGERLLNSIDANICNMLSENVNFVLLEEYFFHTNMDIIRAARKFLVESYLFSDENKIEYRLSMVKKLLIKYIKEGWNEKREDFYPVNYVVHHFVKDIVLRRKSIDVRLIDTLLNIFQLEMNPQMDSMSYLLLIYKKEYTTCKSLKDFGCKIADKIVDLVKIYSEFFIPFMSDCLRLFLVSISIDDWSRLLQFFEGLIEKKNTCAYMMAAQLLCHREFYINNRECYDFGLKILELSKHPAVTSLICHTINRTEPK